MVITENLGVRQEPELVELTLEFTTDVDVSRPSRAIQKTPLPVKVNRSSCGSVRQV
ncbi:hypothetical protein DPMN_033647 [Dreissena polymorpha]|uniref:Uncharacterized protein n=1 Tax=Dreissena polymorpha TaxID=45954 RepID=A0A9D4M6Z8_DREPO|nr:hypothetical protein DPMN_033647 [Dreissena polymorpha]